MIPTPPELFRDLSPFLTPLIYPSESSHHFLIIGGGVTGLTTAWALLDSGHHVTILAKEWATWTKAPRLTSQIAGALWEYPPAVCGRHTDEISLHHSKRWAMASYRIWSMLAGLPIGESMFGVRMSPAGFFYPRQIEDNADDLQKMNELRSFGVKGFRRDPYLGKRSRVNPDYGILDAYEILTPIIDTDVAMRGLMQLVEAKGAKFVTEEIKTDLLLVEGSLRRRYNAEAIVNCAGLGSTKLADDSSCFPLRGAMIRVINDGKDFPKIRSALAVPADSAADNEMVFIVPRNDSILYLGGEFLASFKDILFGHTIFFLQSTDEESSQELFNQMKKNSI